MLLVHTQKISSQIKGFLYFLCTPLFWKKDILLMFSEPCYCHVGEGLAGQPRQKAGQDYAHAAAVGPQGSDEKVMKISRLTCSCRYPTAAGILQLQVCLVIPHCSLLQFLDFFDKNTFGHISNVFHLFFKFF